MIHNLFTSIVLSMAISVFALLMTKANLTSFIRDFLEEKEWTFLHELFSCPFCFSFWVGAVAQLIFRIRLMGPEICQRVVMTFPWPNTDGTRTNADVVVPSSAGTISDYAVTYLFMVGVAAIFSGILYKSISLIDSDDEE